MSNQHKLTPHMCDMCGSDVDGEGITQEIPDVWGEERWNIVNHYCSERCEDRAYETSCDGSTFVCDDCGRTLFCVAGDGMTNHERIFEDERRGVNVVCVACLQKEAIANGTPVWSLEKSTDSPHVDWYNADELRAAGYTLAENVTVYDRHDSRYDDAIQEYIKAGLQIVVSLDLVAIVGGPCYVEIWTRKPRKARKAA